MLAQTRLSPRKVRIAVVQLECHPAFAIDTQDWLGEPFVVEHGLPCLARLEAFRFDIDDLLTDCRNRYLRWAKARLTSVLSWIEERFRSAENQDLPEVLVFPEGSIPRQHLGLLCDFARRTGCVVFAGTHAFETGEEARDEYLSLGIIPQEYPGPGPRTSAKTAEQELLRIASIDQSCKTVLPVIDPSSPHGDTEAIIRLRAKTVLSPFEYTNIGGRRGRVGRPEVITVRLRGADRFPVRVLPLVCSEALQLALPEGQYDLCVICSYNKEIAPFEPIIQYLSANQIPVVYTNDGRYGSSCVTVPLDRRNTSWWFGEPHQGRLPRGDAILVVDVTLGANAPAMGVNNPPEHSQLVALAAVVRAHPRLPAYQVSQRLASIRHRMFRGLDAWVSVEQAREHLAAEVDVLRQRLNPQPPRDGGVPELTPLVNPAAHVSIVFARVQGVRVKLEDVRYHPGEKAEDLVLRLDPTFADLASLEAGWAARTAAAEADDDALRAAATPVVERASQLATLLRDLFAEVFAAPFADSRSLEEELTDLAERLNPTPVQHLNLWHLLQLVRRPRNAYASQWLVHAWDCVTEPDEVRAGVAGPADPDQYPTLRALEAVSAQHTFYRCGHLLDEPATAPGLAQILAEVQRACRELMANVAPVSVSQHVLETLSTFKREAQEKAVERLTRLLGTLVERFRATSGWLFQSRSQGPGGPSLSAVVSHNTPRRYRTVPATSGITSHVLASRRGYLSNHIVDEFGATIDPYYRVFMQTSKSEIAVPIFPAPARNGRVADPRAMAPIAVLNLESNQFGAFLPVQVGELQAAVSQLVPDLLILQATADHTTHAAWHPEAHGWGSARLLDQFCYAVATAAPSGQRAPGLTCTFWNYDDHKGVLYARGTLGFDYEYLAERTLPEESFTGRVVKEASKLADEGRAREAPVHRLDVLSPENWAEFNRRQKIEHLGVSKIISAPVFARRRGRGFGWPSHLAAVGTLNLYFYRHDESFVGVDVAQVFTDALVRRLAELASRLVGDVYTLHATVTAAHLWSLLCDRVQNGMPVFEAVKDALARCFEADGVTVFTRQEADPRGLGYECAATTGLSFRGEAIPTQDAWYSRQECLADAPREHPVYRNRPLYSGLTKFLLARGGQLIRMLDISDLREPVRIRRGDGGFERRDPANPKRSLGLFAHFRPEYRCCEALPNSDATHHRYLGVSIAERGQDHTPAPLGAMRLTRSPASRPFVPHDEEVLSFAARLCQPAFANRLADRRDQTTRLRSLEEMYEVDELWRGGGREGRVWTTWQATVRRLLYVHRGYMTWNRTHVEGLLKDLLDVFAESGAILASLRFSTVGEGGMLYLRPYCVTSRWTNQPPDERRGQPVPITHGNIGWDTILERAAQVYDLDGSRVRFTPIHRDSDQVTWGVCVPFRFFANRHHVDGVLSLDFNSPRATTPWSEREVRWLYLVARQFAWLASANHRPGAGAVDRALLPGADDPSDAAAANGAWDRFVAEVRAAFVADWHADALRQGARGRLHQVCLMNSNDPTRPIRQTDPSRPVWTGWHQTTFADLASVRVRPGCEFEVYGVAIDRGTGTFHFPLFLGPCYVGYVEGEALMLTPAGCPAAVDGDAAGARGMAVCDAEFAELLNDLTDAWNAFANGNDGPRYCWTLGVARAPAGGLRERWQAVVTWRHGQPAHAATADRGRVAGPARPRKRAAK